MHLLLNILSVATFGVLSLQSFDIIQLLFVKHGYSSRSFLRDE